jgi:nitrite reductase (cytochrome c-552)
MQRRAQFYLDFVEAENSVGFHAPQEAMRLLSHSIDLARKGQLALRGVKIETKAQTAPAKGAKSGD